jgi:hypothetical protein
LVADEAFFFLPLKRPPFVAAIAVVEDDSALLLGVTAAVVVAAAVAGATGVPFLLFPVGLAAPITGEVALFTPSRLTPLLDLLVEVDVAVVLARAGTALPLSLEGVDPVQPMIRAPEVVVPLWRRAVCVVAAGKMGVGSLL